jgi:hypothetical protein
LNENRQREKNPSLPPPLWPAAKSIVARDHNRLVCGHSAVNSGETHDMNPFHRFD